jgi:hypothetical protein
MFIQALHGRPAKEQNEFHSHLASYKILCRFDRQTGISPTSAFTPNEHSADPCHGNPISVNFDGRADKPHVAEFLSTCGDEDVLLRWSPLQRVGVRLTRIYFSSSQIILFGRRIRVRNLYFERFPRSERFRFALDAHQGSVTKSRQQPEKNRALD